MFLAECGRRMSGNFYLEPVESDDPCFRVSVNSLEEARRLFRPISGKVFLVETLRKSKLLSLIEREKFVERQEVQELLNSTLTRAQSIDEENNALKQALAQAIEKTRELEVLFRCSICLNATVSVVFMPCQHACSCSTCWRTWSDKYGSFAPCPLCRQETAASMEIRL